MTSGPLRFARHFLLLLAGLMVSLQITAQETVNPNDFGASMNFVGAVEYSGEFSRSDQDIVRFFVNGELRGTSSIIAIPTFEAEVFFTSTIYSNSPTGELVEVEVYHAATDQVLFSLNPFNFQSQGVRGDFINPSIIQIGEPLDEPPLAIAIPEQRMLQTYPFDRLDLSSFFASPDGDDLEYTILNPQTGISWSVNNSNELTAQAEPDFFGTATVTIRATEQTVEAEFVETTIAYTVVELFTGPQWIDIESQAVNQNEAFTVVDLNAASDPRESNCIAFDYVPVFNPDFTENEPVWTSPMGSQATMTMTTRVQYTEKFVFNHENDLLAAFIDDQIVGLASPIEVDGEHLFFLPIGNPNDSDSEVELRFYSAGLQQQFISPMTFAYIPFLSMGDVLNPAMVDFSPFQTSISSTGILEVIVRNPDQPNIETFSVIVTDCDFPDELKDSIEVTYCYGADMNMIDEINMQDVCKDADVYLDQAGVFTLEVNDVFNIFF
jgi:hypothetical protein